jgi:hypothetical protein
LLWAEKKKTPPKNIQPSLKILLFWKAEGYIRASGFIRCYPSRCGLTLCNESALMCLPRLSLHQWISKKFSRMRLDCVRTQKDWKGLQVHGLELEFLSSQYLSIAKALQFPLPPKEVLRFASRSSVTRHLDKTVGLNNAIYCGGQTNIT